MDTEKTQYFFSDQQPEKDNVSEDVLKKGLKLFRASQAGDNKDFATQKYNEFLMDNVLSHSEVLRYEQQDIKKQPQQLNKKSIIVLGVEFNSMPEFMEYYEKQPFVNKFKIMLEILKGSVKK